MPPASVADVQALGAALVDAPMQNSKNIATLIKLIDAAADEAIVREALSVLRIHLVDALHAAASSTASNAAAATPAAQNAAKYSAWLHRQHEAFHTRTLALLRSPAPPPMQLAAVTAAMDFVRAESVGEFGAARFGALMHALLASTHVRAEVVDAFLREYAQYADVRFGILKWVDAAASRLALGSTAELQEWQSPLDDATGTAFHVLAALDPPTDADESGVTSWCGGAEAGLVVAATDGKEGAQARRKRKRDAEASGAAGAATAEMGSSRARWASPKLQKQAFSDAWLSILRLPLPAALYKRALTVLPASAMPHLSNPLLLSDFLTRSIELGGLLGVLALNGLFVLVTQYGLEYPQFYARLYNLLTPSVLTARHRVRFLQLTDVFLASRLVPAYTVAAFAKRFARLALTAPPPGALVCVAFVHNLVRRHPACICLLHNPSPEGAGVGEDVFDNACADPAESRAIESSLWELDALRRHVNPLVAAYVQNVDKPLTDRRKTAELDIQAVVLESYGTMIRGELEKRLRKPPATAFYEPADAPTGLFSTPLPGWRTSAVAE